MAYTYDLTTNLGKVRFFIPDNDSAAYNFEDAEIDYLLTLVGNNVMAAAIKGCRQLARKYAQKATFSGDGLSFQHGQRAQTFAARADELEAEISGAYDSVTMDRNDGYSDAATDSEYQSSILYIKV